MKQQQHRNDSKEVEQLNQIKKRLYECEKGLLESDHEIRAKNSEFVQILILRDIVNDKKAEKLLKAPINQIMSNIARIEQIDYEALDINVDESTLHQIQSELGVQQEALTKQEKKIEDYERVAMLAPECKNEIERIKEEMDKIKEASTETTGERNTITSNLKELREARQDKIQLLLDVLISKVDENYQELTRKSEYVFGRANLYIHDKIDPFKAGIDYIPNPPGKRSIYSVQQLSSGEKTIALLAFQFTLLNDWNLPFIILDEADAHLDEQHVEKVITYISEKFRKQCLYVSHKNQSIHKADSLVGVSFNPDAQTSEAYSLDLRDN